MPRRSIHHLFPSSFRRIYKTMTTRGRGIGSLVIDETQMSMVGLAILVLEIVAAKSNSLPNGID